MPVTTEPDTTPTPMYEGRPVVAYTPRGGAAKLFNSRASEILICGPAGTGKSRACLEKLNALCELHRDIRCLIVRETRKSMTESILPEFERTVLPPGSAVLLAGGDRSHRSRYTFGTGSEIALAGLDEPQRIMSSQYDLIYVAECTELGESEWELLCSRLRNGKLRDRKTGTPWQQIVGCCNPSYPAHWIKKRCDNGKTQYIASEHRDNPTVTPEYLDRLAQLSGVRRQRLFLGQWVAAEGAVYGDFDRAVHVVDRFTIPADWRRIRAVDFGYRDAFVCLWLAVDPDGRVYCYRQLYRTERLVEDHAADILELSAGEYPETTVCDHDREDRGTLERRDIPTVGAQKDISSGIQAVQARLRRGQDGKPRLYILRDSLVSVHPKLQAAKKPTCLEDECESYQWEAMKDGRALKEVPADRDNHALDALRYGIRYIDSGMAELDVRLIGRESLENETARDADPYAVFRRSDSRRVFNIER